MNDHLYQSQSPEYQREIFPAGEVSKELTHLELSSLGSSFSTEYVDKKGRLQLVGRVSRDQLKKSPFSAWYNEGYSSYKVDKKSLKGIERKLKGVSVEVYAATWCGDTQRELPRFAKIMDSVDKSFSVIAVNREKKTPLGLEKGKNIQRVPTFIFYENGKEIGRIIEIPKKSLEKDMMEIVE